MHSINSGTFTGTTFLFLISLLISVGLINVGAILNPTNLYHNCTTFVPSSLYQSNLNTVLSSLSSSAEASREFHNASAGGVYGLFLCRGDVNATACRDCVTFATGDVVKRCPPCFGTMSASCATPTAPSSAPSTSSRECRS